MVCSSCVVGDLANTGVNASYVSLEVQELSALLFCCDSWRPNFCSRGSATLCLRCFGLFEFAATSCGATLVSTVVSYLVREFETAIMGLVSELALLAWGVGAVCPERRSRRFLKGILMMTIACSSGCRFKRSPFLCAWCATLRRRLAVVG